MEWVKEFYGQQYKWMQLNDDVMLDMQKENLEKLERFVDQPVKKILELGGGKGYFAVAAAIHGYEVTVIELIDAAAHYIRELAEKHQVSDKVTIINGDFYTEEIADQFDAVCYWDGFGIGSDSDQKLLLERIQHWMKPHATALIDIYTPWFWAYAAGQEMQLGENVVRRYDFDALNCKMLDMWWNKEEPAEKTAQSLRCYSPADFTLLTQDLGLSLVHCEPGGSLDYTNGTYIEKAPLDKAMSYLVTLMKH